MRPAAIALVAMIATMLADPTPARAETATGYCLNGRMADGSWTRAGSLAHNGYPLGTNLWATPAVYGRHRWTVRDRIGWGTQADFWAPRGCGQARAFGRRTVRLTVGWHGWELRHDGFPAAGPSLRRDFALGSAAQGNP